MKFEEYQKDNIITQILEIEKNNYVSFLKKAYEDDKLMINIALTKSTRWTVIISYYAMHDITKYYLAKKHNLKITGRGVHLATIVALKYVITNNSIKKEILNLIQEAQEIYNTLNSPLKEKIIPTMLFKGKDEREKSQYYTSKKDLDLADMIIFKEQIVEPYLKIMEELLK